jgi:hypothetical protein
MFAASLLLARIMLAPVTRLEEAVRRMRDGETAPGQDHARADLAPESRDGNFDDVGIAVEILIAEMFGQFRL